MKIHRYSTFIKESINNSNMIPSYEECLEMCSKPDAAFYELKFTLQGFPVSVFNYRLAQYSDFVTPLEHKPDVKAYEMRGLTFVFNEDGSLFKRFVLLEKFFNINQVPESMYSIVKNYKIKYVNNKEDGSIASFIQLPNGKIIGKSKMGFDNDQANGINRIYRTNRDVKKFVDWCVNNNITSIFEYVAPHNRIVLRYFQEELILLRLRDNNTGRHIDIKDHLDKIGSIKVAPFKDDFKDLDDLLEITQGEIDKEGYVVQSVDDFGNDKFFKLKTPWYMALHGLLTDDIYREHVIINYILDDKIDDILGQIPEEQYEARERIEKIIKIVKEKINEKVIELKASYNIFLDLGSDRKQYALRYYRKEPNFGYVIQMSKGDDPFDLAKSYIREKTKRLQMAREWLKNIDPTLFFKDVEENEDN
jgi:T4 RnlA family RNA ligase